MKKILTILMAVILLSCSDDDGIKPLNKELVKSTYLEAVDLGLSVDWASCNIGAKKPGEFGGHYCWGDPTGLETAYTIEGMPTKICGGELDIVAANFGNGWRLPTDAEVKELVNKCTNVKASRDGHQGIKITGPSGKSIFLPKAGYTYRDPNLFFGEEKCGYYWIGEAIPSKKWGYYLFLGTQQLPGSNNVSYGLSVRAVREKSGSNDVGDDDGDDDDSGSGNTPNYEKPDISFYDYDATTTSVTVRFKIYNRDKAKVTSARVYYGTNSSAGGSYKSATISGVYISAKITGLKKGTSYYVKCRATGAAGSTTSEIVKVATLY